MEDHLEVNDSENNSRRQLDFDSIDILGDSSPIVEEQEEQHDSDKGVDANDKSKNSLHDNISHELIRQLGMQFDSEKDAYDFYNRYAKEARFSIRRNKGHQDEDGRWLDRTFCCSREGDRRVDKRCEDVNLSRPRTRCGCLAMLKINVRHNLNNKLQVEKFISEHTHGLVATPKKRMFLRSQRHINSAQAAELEIANESGISPKLSVGFMAKKAGGYENLGFIPKDCSNYLQSKRSEKMKVGDTGGVLEYLQKKQCEDPKFSYFIQLDVDELITNIFWADGRMKTYIWLEKLFEKREKWALVYGRQYFCAKMTTTQRSESMNSQLRRYVSYNYNLLRFFEHFERLVEDRRFAELNADFNASQSKPSKDEKSEILQHAARVYTPAIYKLFYQEGNQED